MIVLIIKRRLPMTIGTQRPIISKPFRWNSGKNQRLRAERGVGFEDVVLAVRTDGLRAIERHRNAARYPSQRLWVVAIGNYAYIVPVVEEDDYYFLKTIIPSRKATRDYLRSDSDTQA